MTIVFTFGSRMKKAVVLLLSILYITTSSGATLHLHYCMGELVELGLWKNDNNKCENCGMTKSGKSGDCCKDDHKQVKGEKDQKLVNTTINQIVLSGEALAASYTLPANVNVPSAILENPSSNAPPRSSKIDYYILNCTYRI
jgi:hypothetical protein